MPIGFALDLNILARMNILTYWGCEYGVTLGIIRFVRYHSSGPESSLDASSSNLTGRAQPTKMACCSGVVGIKLCNTCAADDCFPIPKPWIAGNGPLLDDTDVILSSNELVEAQATRNSRAERSRVPLHRRIVSFLLDISRAGYSSTNPS